MGEKHRCEEKVYNASVFRSLQCSRNGKYQENGKWYCKQHLPSEVKKRRAAEKTRRDEERLVRKAESACESARDAVVEAADYFERAPYHDDEDEAERLLNEAVYAYRRAKQALADAKKKMEG